MKKFLFSIKQSFITLEIGFKVYILTTLMFIIAQSLNSELEEKLMFIPYFVVQKYQYWRLFSSFLVNGQLTFVKILYFLVNLFFLNISIRQLEKKYSTLYIIIEIIKQVFLINLILTTIYYPLMAFNLIENSVIYTEGMTTVTINFAFLLAIRSKENIFSLYFMELKLKYLPWVLLIVMIGFFANSSELLSFISIFAISLAQYSFFNKPLLALPLGFYQTLQKIIPNYISKSRGYVAVSHSRTSLQELCQTWCKARQNRQRKMQDNSQYQQHWKEKQFDQPAESNKIKQNQRSQNQKVLHFQRQQQEPHNTEIKCDLTVSQIIQHKEIDYKSHWESKYSLQQQNEQFEDAQNYNELTTKSVIQDIQNQASQQRFDQFVGTSVPETVNQQNYQQNLKETQKTNEKIDIAKIAPAEEEEQQWY